MVRHPWPSVRALSRAQSRADPRDQEVSGCGQPQGVAETQALHQDQCRQQGHRWNHLTHDPQHGGNEMCHHQNR